MAIAPAISHPSFYLDGLYVNPDKNVIELETGPQFLQPKLMEVLCYLCGRHGQVVSVEALIEACWPNQYISDSPLHKCIAQLRAVLHDNAKNSRYIKTISRKGYMIVAPVVGLQDTPNSHTPYWTGSSPYPGARAYTEKEKAIFFGREQAVEELVALLRELPEKQHEPDTTDTRTPGTSWISVHGASGCGKTSFIQAGVKPKLRESETARDSMANCWFDFDVLASNDEKNYIALLNLLFTRRLLAPSIPLEDHVYLAEKTAIAALPQSGFMEQLKQGLSNKLHQSRAVIFIDHLEALFQQEIDHTSAVFLSILNTLAEAEQVILITATQEQTLLDLEGLCPLHSNAQKFGLPKFSKSEITDIIQKPADAAGLRFGYNAQSRERLDVFLIHQQQASPVPIPLLQALLAQLYEQREGNSLTHEGYENIGGVEALLADSAERAFLTIPEHLQPNFYDQLFGLVELNTAGDAVTIAAPLDISDMPKHIRQQLFGSLVMAGVLMEETRGERTLIRLSHESLLQHWPRLHKWINDRINTFYLRHDVQVATERWLYHEKQKDFLLESATSLRKINGMLGVDGFALNDNEHKFIERSARRTSLRQRLKLGAISGLVASVCALIWLSLSLQNKGIQLQESRSNAEDLISAILYDLKDKLEPLGKLELLEIVGAEAKEYFDASGTRNLSPDGVIQWSSTLNIMAQVHSEKLEYDKALVLFQKSKKAIDSALTEVPNHIGLSEQSMFVNFWIGNIHFRQRDYTAATPFFQKYLDSANNLLALEPENEKWQLEASYALTNMGSLARFTGNAQTAADYFGRSVTIKEKLLSASPDNHKLRDGLANTLSWQATAMERMGALSAALKVRESSVEHGLHLHSAQPNNHKWIRRLALLEQGMAFTLYDLGHLEKSLEHGRKAQAHLTKLVENDQENQRDRERLISNHVLIGQILRHQKKYDESLVNIASASKLATSPDIAMHATLHAIVLNEQAKLYAEIDQGNAALSTIEQAIETLVGVADPTPHNNAQRAELLLVKVSLLKSEKKPLEKSLLDEISILQRDILLQLEQREFDQPRHLAIYNAMIGLTGQSAKPPDLLADQFFPEYRNPDLAQINSAISASPN